MRCFKKVPTHIKHGSLYLFIQNVEGEKYDSGRDYKITCDGLAIHVFPEIVPGRCYGIREGSPTPFYHLGVNEPSKSRYAADDVMVGIYESAELKGLMPC